MRNPDCDGLWEGIKGNIELRYFANIEHDTPTEESAPQSTMPAEIG